MAACIYPGWVEVPSAPGEAEVHRAPDAMGCGGLTKGSPGVLLTATGAEGCGLHIERGGLVSDPIPPKL